MLTPLHESDPRVTPRVGYSPVYTAFTTEKKETQPCCQCWPPMFDVKRVHTILALTFGHNVLS